MTPLERAARVLARRSCPPGGEAQFPYVSADEWEEKNWRDHVPAARAVIDAIREPDGALLDVIHGCSTEHDWRNMIDTILGEEDRDPYHPLNAKSARPP